MSPRVKKIKTKIHKLDLIKLKIFFIAKKTINKMKRQPTGWEKIFAKGMTNKGLTSKMYKQLIQLKIQDKSKQPSQKKKKKKKRAEDFSRHFAKTTLQVADRHKKRYSV